MNRRSFVQSLGASAVGLLALEQSADTLAAAAPQAAAPAVQGRPDMSALIRIGSNENPYGPAASVLEAVGSSAKEGNRYPGPVQQKLIDAIALKFSVPADYVMLSGGSGDILNAVVKAFTSKTKNSGMCHTGGAHFGAAKGSLCASTATFSPGLTLRNSHAMMDDLFTCLVAGERRGGRRDHLQAAPPCVRQPKTLESRAAGSGRAGARIQRGSRWPLPPGPARTAGDRRPRHRVRA